MSYQDRPRRDERGGRNEPSVPRPRITTEDLELIISGQSDTAAQELVLKAAAIGEWLKSMEFSTSQIRNIFGVVRQIEQRIEIQDSQAQKMTGQVAYDNASPLPDAAYRDLVLLKPKLAYQTGRGGSEGKKSAREAMGFLQRVLSDAIDRVGRDRNRFKHFVQFFEAILAYHRYYGGKN